MVFHVHTYYHHLKNYIYNIILIFNTNLFLCFQCNLTNILHTVKCYKVILYIDSDGPDLYK